MKSDRPRRFDKGITLAVILALGMAACALPAVADDGGIENVGGAARLLTDQGHIRMMAETVHARVSPESISVDCVFTFVNHGPADTVLIGFPDRSEGQSGGDGSPTGFCSWVDGVEVTCDSLPDEDRTGEEQWSFWWTKRVFFAAGQTRVIRDHYRAEPGSSSDGSQHFEYILETGASWAGTIGSAEIVVTLERISPKWIMRWNGPKPVIKGRELHWSMQDFEPGSNENIQFSWMSPKTRAENERMAREERDRQRREREEGGER